MDIFTLVGKIALDGMDKVKSDLSGLEGVVERNSGKIKALGAVFTAVGAAGLKMSDDARKLNSQLGATGITIGASTDEMRKLALETTDVTFPLQSVADTFDILARAGIKSTEQIQAAAKAFDTLGDATGSNAETVAEQLIPAFKNLGVEIPTTAEELDKFTWLTKNTTVNLTDFASAIDYVAAYGSDLNLTIDDMVAIMAALEAKGITGSAVTRVFRTAVSQAASGATDLNTALGLTGQEVDTYKDKLSEANGITQEYADQLNTQYGFMDKLKQKWQEFTLVAGSFLEPLEPILAAMTALGPALIFVSTQTGIATIKWIAHTAALVAHKVASSALTVATGIQTVAQWALNAAMNANPIGLIITLIGGLVAAGIALYKNWDKITDFFKDAWENIKLFFLRGVDFALGALEKFLGWLPGLGPKIKAAHDAISNMIEVKEIENNIKDVQREYDDMAKSINDEAKEMTKTEKEEADKRKQITLASIKEELEAKKAAALSELSTKKDAARKGYEAAVDAINKEYGEYKQEVKTKQDLAKDASEVAKRALQDELSLAERAHDEKMDLLREEYDQKIRTLNAETDAQIQRIQAQIDAIDAQTEAENLAITRANEQQRLADLQAAIDSAKTDEEKAQATKEYAEYESEVARNELLRQRDDQKDALRTQIDQIRANAQTQEDILREEMEAKQKALDDDLAATKANIQQKSDALDQALQDDLTRIEQDRLAAIEAEADKLAAVEGNLAQQEQALKDHYDEVESITALHNEAMRRLNAELALQTAVSMPQYEAPPPLPQMAEGGVIPEPTLLYGLTSMRPYAIAGEAGPEIVSPGIQSSIVITGNTFNVRSERDIDLIAQSLVDKIRLKTGAKF